MITVTCVVQTDDNAPCNLTIQSNKQIGMVGVEMFGNELVVNADDLIAAVQNATNTNV